MKDSEREPVREQFADAPDLNGGTVNDLPAPAGAASVAPEGEETAEIPADLNGATVAGASAAGGDEAGLLDKTITGDAAEFRASEDYGTGSDSVSAAGQLGAATITDAPAQPVMPDLGAKTLASDIDLGGKTMPGGGDGIDLAARTMADESAPVDLGARTMAGDAGQVDLGGRTMVGGSGGGIDLGAKTMGGDGVPDLSAATLNTINKDVQQQWMATIQQGLKETMTIKGKDKDPATSEFHPNKSTHITVNTRTVTDQTKKVAFAGNITVKEREIADIAGKGARVDYELRKVLGEGGMGIVYQARQTSIDRSIAMKMIKGQAVHDQAARSKFLSEAAVTGDLDHPNIVPIYDLGDNGSGVLFYAMKHVKGKPWNEMFKKKTLGENLDILMAVSNAVAFAHDRGVVHRDLKPENVMLGDYGEVLVMDWGLAAAFNEKGKAAPLSVKASVCGTPAYMSPEMAVGEGAKIGPVSDVYLLGAILFELLSGYAPHTGKTVLQCLENAALNVIREAKVPDELSELLDIAMRAMATSVEDRYKTVPDFTDAVKEYRSHSESINLTQRAAKDLEKATGTSREYDDFSRAVFGFQEALNLWKQNVDAREGLSRARLAYAQCAFGKGDLDLAESQLVEMTDNFKVLRDKVVKERVDRQKKQRTLAVAKYVVIGLIGVVLIGGTFLGFQIYKAKQVSDQKSIEATKSAEKALEEQKKAVAAADAAKKAESQAVAEKKAADEQRELAKKAAADAEKSAKEAQEALKKAQIAEAARRLEEARNEKLQDVKRWALTAEEAKAKQKDEAEKLGWPAVREVALGKGNVTLKLALIPPGRFTMGSPPTETGRDSNESLHDVMLDTPFYMGVYEFTQAQWEAVMPGKQPSKFQGGDVVPRHPVDSVSYNQVLKELLPKLQAFAPAGFKFDLPSEAEWEYACRAGTPTAYYFGNDQKDLGKYAWFGGKDGNSNKRTQYTGKKDDGANAWGLFDMHGNVAELCLDTFEEDYYLKLTESIMQQAEQAKKDKEDFLPVAVDPVDRNPGEHNVVRGGSWLFVAENCRSAYRSSIKPDRQFFAVGFRVVLRPEAKPGK